MRNYQKEALGIARDLGYSENTMRQIINAKTEIEVERALTTARQERIKRDEQLLCFDN